jgi:hypothetical protein
MSALSSSPYFYPPPPAYVPPFPPPSYNSVVNLPSDSKLPPPPYDNNWKPQIAPIKPAQPSQQLQMLQEALVRLGQIQNLPQDIKTLGELGIKPLFTSGAEAMKLIQDRGIRVEFGDMGDSPAHAEWQSAQNRIIINQKYQNDTSSENLYAISEAIYHEAGHASGNGDDRSSIQEELNCLALNALGYRYHVATDPSYAASASKSPLINNGVALYSRLFFGDPDSQRNALVRRVTEKYGDLPLQSPGHPNTPGGLNLASRVAEGKRQQALASYAPMLASPSVSQSQSISE